MASPHTLCDKLLHKRIWTRTNKTIELRTKLRRKQWLYLLWRIELSSSVVPYNNIAVAFTASAVQFCIQHQGHLASRHLNKWPSALLSFNSVTGLASDLYCESDANAVQDESLISRAIASSLYAGLLYLGCCMNWTFFHHSLRAYNIQFKNMTYLYLCWKIKDLEICFASFTFSLKYNIMLFLRFDSCFWALMKMKNIEIIVRENSCPCDKFDNIKYSGVYMFAYSFIHPKCQMGV